MPAAFAHDLYGRKVYMEADPVIKRIIKKERYCFLLWVHGPDILFFYKALGKNKVNQKGVRMHGEPAAKLMERGRMLVREAETKDERDEMIAYLIDTVAEIFALHDIETEIIAASVRHTMHVTECALAGADIATVPYKVIEQMTHHPLTDQGIEKFRKDYEAVFGK